jgi:RHS repeat-associated protein
MMIRALRLAVLAVGVSFGMSAHAATDWSAQDYDLYPGDFNGDGVTDILYVAKHPSMQSGITSLSTAYVWMPPVSQTWEGNHLGIQWYGNAYTPVLGDYNGDGRTDILLQRNSPGDSYLLLANSLSTFTSIKQTISNNALGIGWSSDQHRIIAGNFTGRSNTGRRISDLFFQATTSAGTNFVVSSASDGSFTSPAVQAWTDATWSAFKWSARDSVVTGGDFNGDGRADLLVQAKPSIVMIDYDVSIPVPVYKPNTFGVALSSVGAAPFQQSGIRQWSRNAFGVDWSPTSHVPIVGDFNGDGIDDVVLQARTAGRQSFLVTGRSSGATFNNATPLAANVSWAADSVRLIAGNFDAVSGSGLYFQAQSPTGSNTYANVVNGSSVTATTHNTTALMGVQPTTAVGSMMGSASVTSGGVGTYSIPIELPTGINGVMPSLGVFYNSHAGVGVLGPKWDLSGLSSIARCARTVAQDGSPGYANILASDKYCLDGKRLRLVSGTPGVSGAIYRTEVEQFSRITVKATQGNGPQWFEVEAKDGLIYEYGNTEDARALYTGWEGIYLTPSSDPALNTTVMKWKLNKVRDRSGNFYTVKYLYPNSVAPDEIKYTGHGAIAPFYSIKFDYTYFLTSSEQMMSMVFGSTPTQLPRLTSITVNYSGSQVRRYGFAYSAYGNGSPNRALLHSVQLCGTSNAHCLAPTTFGWSHGESGWMPVEGGVRTVPSQHANSQMLDMDGDGRDDLAFYDYSTSRWKVMWGSSSGFSAAVDTGATSPQSSYGANAGVADVDGDGRLDLVIANSGVWYLLRYLPNGSFSYAATGVAVLGTQSGLADIDGDGYADLVSAAGPNIYLNLHASDGSAAFSQTPIVAYYSGGGTIAELSTGNRSSTARTQDFDGDGRKDVTIKLGSYFYALLSNGTAFVVAEGGINMTQIVGGIIPVNGSAGSCTDMMIGRQSQYETYGPGTIYKLSSLCTRSSSGFTQLPAGQWSSYAPNTVFIMADPTGAGIRQVIAYLPGFVSGSGETSPPGWRTGFPDGGPGTLPESFPELSVPSSPGAATIFTADIDGDTLDDIVWIDQSGIIRHQRHKGFKPEMLTTAVDGLGNITSFEYRPTSSGNCHTRDSGAPSIGSAMVAIASPFSVVCSTSSSDGIGGVNTTSYKYYNYNANVKGRGGIGFERRTVTDGQTGFVSEEQYRQDFPFAGMIRRAVVRQFPNGPKLSEATGEVSELVYLAGTSEEAHFPYQRQSTEDLFELQRTTGDDWIARKVSTVLEIDQFGNVSDHSVETTDKDSASPFRDQTTRVLTERTIASTGDALTYWCHGRPTHVEMTTTLHGGATQTKKQSAVIDYQKCRADTTYLEKDDNYFEVRTDYVYGSEGCGAVTSVSITGRKHDGSGTLPTRSSTAEFNNGCRFPSATTTPLGRSVHTYNLALGMEETETDPNGLTETFYYDPFARLSKQINTDGTSTEFNFSACKASNGFCGVPDLRIRKETVLKSTTGVSVRTAYQYADSLGRMRVEAEPLPVSGTLSYVDTTYNNLGQIVSRTVPYAGAYQGKSVFAYDLRGRQISAKLFDAGGTVVRQNGKRHEGLKIVYIDGKLNETTKTLDVLGQLRAVQDPGTTSSTSYEYSFESGGVAVSKVTDSKGNVSTHRMDRFGQKIQMSDPDLGIWQYKFDSLGQLMWQIDAKSQETLFQYDEVGRIKKRIEKSANGTIAEETDWTYGTVSDNSATGGKYVGHVKLISTSAGYSEKFTYDGLGRLQSSTFNMGVDGLYTSSVQYQGTTSLVDTITYPVSTGTNPLKVKYGYSHGLQVAVHDFTGDQLGTAFWQLNATDSDGRPTDEMLGNGVRVMTGFYAASGAIASRKSGANGSATNRQNLTYEWDINGNLERRTDDNQAGLTERFYYDQLNRLDYSTLNGATNLDLAYDEIGNITQKSDIGAYSYPASGPNSVRPHAVSSAGSASYSYDNNGNMTSRPGTTMAWNVDNSVKYIAQGSIRSDFWYGGDGQRIKQVAAFATGSETTLYVGGMMEVVTLAGGERAYRHLIGAGGNSVIHTRWSTGAVQNFYVTTDSLGSDTNITDQTGSVVLYQSFDAFGKRRKSNWTAGTPLEMQAIANVTRHGYTGHEHLDNLGLIHMNGRVQDPTLGRFISADPFIQAPDYSQSLNRYSYVWNNPLSMTDPSGFFGGPDDREMDEIAHPIRQQAVHPPVVVTDKYLWSPLVLSFNATSSQMGISVDMGNLGSQNTEKQNQTIELRVEVIEKFERPKKKSRLQRSLEVVIEFAPGYDVYVCITQSCGVGGWALAVITSIPGEGTAIKIVAKAGKVASPYAKKLLLFFTKCGCFIAGTMVATANGMVPIESLQIGDSVLSRDELTGETAYKPILDVYVNDEGSVWELVIVDANGKVDTHDVTADHPYLTSSGEWVTAEDLEVGTDLTTESGTSTTLVAKYDTGVVLRTYNLEVADFHTYFVGEQRVLVHNGSPNCDLAKKLARFDGPKPTYARNPAHVPGQRGFNPSKTPLPKDAESVYKNAVPNDPKNPTAWFGKSADGQIYRFSPSNDGTMHFSGIDGVGDGVRNLTNYALERMNGL